MRILILAAAFFLAAGCAQSSGVLKMGPDTYTVSAAAAPARGGPSEARGIALTDANRYCLDLGKEIVVLDVKTETTNRFGAGSSEVTFRCLAKGDPDLQRPGSKPDSVIEHRMR